MRSKIVKALLDSITDEDIARWKQERLEYKKSLTLEYQLGCYVGEYIVDHYLPTLSTDPILTRTVIKVSEEDKIVYDNLHSIYFEHSFGTEKTEESKAAWQNYRTYCIGLQMKYLPKRVDCYLPQILNVEDVDQFKKGIIDALWNCDTCSYNLKPEKILIVEDEDLYSTKIVLELDVEK